MAMPTEQSAVGNASDGDDSSSGSRMIAVSRGGPSQAQHTVDTAQRRLTPSSAAAPSGQMIRKGNLQLVRQPTETVRPRHADHGVLQPPVPSVSTPMGRQPLAKEPAGPGTASQPRSSVFARMQNNGGSAVCAQQQESIKDSMTPVSVMSRLTGRKRQPEACSLEVSKEASAPNAAFSVD